MEAIEILKNLIPRVKTDFTLPPITISETKSIIKRLKNSSCTGHDPISNRIIKSNSDVLTPFISLIINSIIQKSKFPNIFKITKLLPFLKPNKTPHLIESYRPINNLPCVEKIFEEYWNSH